MDASPSVSLTVLSSELQQLCIEVRSDSLSSRHKAIERLDNILSSRKSEVIECIANSDYGKHLTWAILFNNAFDAVIKHAVKLDESKHLKSYATLKNKNFLFSTVVNKIIDSALEAKSPIKCGLLIESATSGIENIIVFEYFSTLLFQIIEKGLIVINGHLVGVKTKDLNCLLRQCLCCYSEGETESGKTLSLLRCINKVLDLSTKYSLVCVTLPEHLEYVSKISHSSISDKSTQQEIIKLLHSYVSNVVVDCHEELANLLQLAMPRIICYYDFRIKVSVKELFFELCAIMLGVHYFEDANFHTVVHIVDEDNWKALLRKLFNIVKTEIKEKSLELNKNSSHSHCDKFLLFASMASYMIYWNPIFDSFNNDGPRKLAKISTKFQGLLDLALPVGNKVNWGWFTILAECMATYYRHIEETDFQPMLQIIVHFQRSVALPSQVNSLFKYCAVLLHKEKEFVGSTFINQDFCNERWREIVDTAINHLLQKTLVHDELQELIQYLVRFKKFANDSLVSLIRSFTKDTKFRTDSCLTTIHIAVTYYRHNFLSNSEIVKDLLFWLYPMTVGIDVKSMMNNKSTNPQLMAEIVAALIAEKDEYIQDASIDRLSTSLQSSNFLMIQKTLMFNYTKKLIFIEEGENISNKKKIVETQKLIVDDKYLKLLLDAIDFNPESIAHRDSSDLLNNMKKLETIIAILRTFSDIGKIDKNDLCLSAIIKKAIFLWNAIEFQLGEVNIEREKTNAKDILLMLEKILENLNHPTLSDFIKTGDNQAIIQYLQKSIKWLSDEDGMYETEELIYHRKLAHHCIKVLAMCDISEEAFVCIEDFEINFHDEHELESVLSTIEVFCRHKQNSYVVKWIMSTIQDICRKHHENLKLSQELIRLLPAIAIYIKPFGRFDENVSIILSSFLKKSYQKCYPPHFVSNLLVVIRDIAKIYCELVDDDDLTQIYESVTKFLTLPSKTIQYAVVDCLSRLVHDKWLFENSDAIPFRHSNLCNRLFEAIDSFDLNGQAPKNGVHPVILQIHLAFFSLNYNLEQLALSRLMRLGFFSRKDAQGILKDISRHLNRDTLSVFKHNMFPLLLEWFQMNDRGNEILQNPPWVAFAEDEEGFLLENRRILEFCAIYGSTDSFRKLSNRMKGDIQNELKNMIPVCVGVLLPHFYGRSSGFQPYGCSPHRLIKNFREFNLELNTRMITPDSVWIVIYYCIQSIWDTLKFSEYFGFQMCWPKISTINFDNFIKVVTDFLSVYFPSQTSVLDSLLAQKPTQIVRLLNALKTNYENSYCIENKLHYFFILCVAFSCIEMSLTRAFQKDKLIKVAAYFTRDVFHYLSNIIKSNVECILILKAALNFLCDFCKAIHKTHPNLIEDNLHLIVRTLVKCVSNEHLADTSNKCFELLNQLICENSKISTKSITLLDDFPADAMYQNLRNVHEEIKYKNQTRCLWDEINYFLEVKHRGVTGFQKLRQCLADKKKEIDVMCNFINKTTEEVRASPIFSLLEVLLKSIKSKNVNVSKEAALCLGELGPVNLTTIALFSDMKEVCYEKFTSNDESLKYFISSIITAVEQLLLSENWQKVSLGIEICEHFVNSKIGKKCLGKSPLLQIFGENYDNMLYVLSPTNKISFTKLLSSTENLEFKNWITAFTSQTYANISSDSLSKLAAIDNYFCDQTLTAFFKFLLFCEDKKHLESIEEMVKIYFQHVYLALERPMDYKNSKIYLDKAVVKLFLNLSECVRIHNQTSESQVLLNYLHVARACIYCEAYFMAVLYLELWGLSEESEKAIENSDFQYIAKEAFTNIGYMDAISGFLSPINSRLEYLSLQNNWHVVMLELDATPKSNNAPLYERCLRQNGFYSLASTLDTNRQDYEVLWRLGNWDVTKDDCKEHFMDNQEVLEKQFQMHHYMALRSLKRIEEENVMSAIASARQSVIDILNLVSSECAQSIYKYVTWLQLIQQIEDFCEIQFQRPNESTKLFQKWDAVSNMDYGHFDLKELSTSQKITLFDIAGVRANRKTKEYYKGDNVAADLLLKLVTECKFTGNKNLIIRNIAKLMNMNLSNELKTKVLIEDAAINWKMGNTLMAKSILHNIAKSEIYAFCFKKVDALRIYGEYLAESNTESFHTVYKRFFLAASKLWDNFTEMKDNIAKTRPNVLKDYEQYSHNSRKEIYRSIAKYADREYTQLNAYVNSEDYQLKIKLMGKNQIDANSIREAKRYKTNRDELCTLNILAQNVGIDDYEIKTIDGKRNEYLILSIENYIQYCSYDDSVKSMEIFRLISLWFANKDSSSVLEKITNCIETVPSYKFICVLNQMTARIGSGESEFNHALQNLIEKCCIEHPHHTLPYIIAIAHATLDSIRTTTGSSPRMNVAKSIMNEISKNKTTTEIVSQMQTASKVLIEFANKAAKDCVHNTLSDNLRRLKNLDQVQCHTLEMPISANKEYAPTSIVKWKEKFTFVGGINAPKKITCLCSDGIERIQLLKGKDDLRQDAIMQQIFGIVNDMLLSDKDTSKRKMRIRTYKVVPFSMRSGILEWCENTIPLGLYLTGEKKNGGAHLKYYPNEYPPDKCVKLMLEKHRKTPEERFKVFMDVCSNFSPVFHNFFFENFLNPEVWFEKRLAYTNSVAINSMVGYILGLGDRHVQNILIDQITAEVIHIDFGIAFEQGKVMPTPETVPFRLTRDIVAPFGVCGVDGIFRKSCEKMMEVLRENQSVMMTVLEVLVYDPLYIWIVKRNENNEKVEREESIDKEEQNATAHRALIRVRAKLMGMEDIGSCVNSVEGQVQKLIKQAMDKRNLSLLFPGWNPHL